METDISPAPILSVFLPSDLNVASLLVVTGEDKAQVFLDGRPYKSQTKGGRLLISNLTPKKYAVRVSEDGFQDVPEQSVTLYKGQQSQLTFRMLASPRHSSLVMAGAASGTEVFIDQVSFGMVQPDGSFSLKGIEPGDHILELRKEGFVPKRMQEHFSAGSMLTLGSAETVLEADKGGLRINFTPADASVTLARAGETPIKVSDGATMTLAPGAYTLSATTGNHTQTSIIQILAGQTRTLDLSFVPGGMAGWEVPGGWRQDGNVFVRKGGGFVFYKAVPSSGTFIFSAMVRKGHRLQWILNGRDDRNYLLYEMDDEFLSRSAVQSGHSAVGTKMAYKTDKKKFRTFRIQVSSSEITTQIQNGQSWNVLDRLVIPGVDLAAGKFGFLIPNNDEVLLANFNHYAEQSLK